MKSTETTHPVRLWHVAGGEPAYCDVCGPVVLSDDGAREWSSSMPADEPVLVPVVWQNAADRVLAVVIFAEITGIEVAVDGVRVAAGMHLLRHADSVEVGSGVFWVAAATAPREEAYEPAVHGADVFCFRTKARLAPGAPIVVCPGVPGKSCGMLYSRSAWDVGLACHHCGFDPNAPEWHPPAWTSPHTASAAARLLERARTSRRRNGAPS